MPHNAKFTPSQSHANRDDDGRTAIEALLSKVAHIRAVTEIRRYTSGFGGCTVMLVRMDTAGPPTQQPWILKTGPAAELAAEAKANQIADLYVRGDTRVHLKHHLYDEGLDTAALLFEFAGYSGAPPRDFASVLRGTDALKATKAVVDLVSSWANNSEMRSVDLSQQLVRWTKGKLSALPEELRSTIDTPVIYSMDLGEAFANPAYYIKRNECPEVTVTAPFGFAHGDLNLHNVLFDSPREPRLDRPLVIDFRHAGTDHWSIVDYAKLESCLKYQQMPKLADPTQLEQLALFLGGLRSAMKLQSPPERLGDKLLQERWQAIALIRQAALAALRAQDDRVYWTALAAYGVSTATYTPFAEHMRVLAYCDAAAIFTATIRGWDRTASQKPVHADDGISPALIVQSTHAPDPNALLQAASFGGDLVLVVGGEAGRTAGVMPFGKYVGHLYRNVTKTELPRTMRASLGLTALARQSGKASIVEAARRLAADTLPLREQEELQKIEPKVIIGEHFSASLLRALRSSTLAPRLRRIDRLENLSDLGDLLGDSVLYLPYYGDIESRVDELRIADADRRTTRDLLARVGEISSRRGRSIVIVFWKCEEWSIEEIAALRSDITSQATVPDRAFYVSDLGDDARDVGLGTLGIHRIAGTLADIANLTARRDTPLGSQGGSPAVWPVDDILVPLPDVARLTKGLIRYFPQVGSLLTTTSMEAHDYFSGRPPIVADVRDGRIVRRGLVGRAVVPALRAASRSTEQSVRLVCLAGRPGAGVSSILCDVALEASEIEHMLVVSVAHASHRPKHEWREAGSVLAELYRSIRTPPVLAVDLQDCSLDDVDALAQAVVDADAQLVILAGGRRETIELTHRAALDPSREIVVPDTLEKAEWTRLAESLQRAGYGTDVTVRDLARRLADVGIILPAVYEATDHKNRRFREIVQYEYERFRGDELVQRAYRIICALGAHGYAMSEYWLLKTLGHFSTSESARILAKLSEDLLIEPASDRTDASEGGGDPAREAGGEVLIQPRHRLIAEQVLEIASPDPRYRVADVRAIVEAANLGSEREGSIVARLLHHKGSFISWVEKTIEPHLQLVSEIYEVVLGSRPLKDVEIEIRQHYALFLRRKHRDEPALATIAPALNLDPENPATLHVAGLVHQSRALHAWTVWGRSGKEEDHAIAAAIESEARRFFFESRRLQPEEEYGYEAEARYVRQKHERFEEAGKPTSDLEAELGEALWLLWQAEKHVPSERRKELPTTRARLLARIGNLEAATNLLQEQLARTADPMRRARLRSALAAIYIEAEKPNEASEVLGALIESGERTAGVYLLLDDALGLMHADAATRAKQLRESAEEYNRRHVETLLRFAELLAYDADWEGARRALARADDAARETHNWNDRDRVRDVFKTSLYGGSERVFSGQIRRLHGPHEGQIAIDGVSGTFFFRTSREGVRAKLESEITCKVGLRIRGLRAVAVQVVARPKK